MRFPPRAGAAATTAGAAATTAGAAAGTAGATGAACTTGAAAAGAAAAAGVGGRTPVLSAGGGRSESCSPPPQYRQHAAARPKVAVLHHGSIQSDTFFVDGGPAKNVVVDALRRWRAVLPDLV
jgi:hypothetical protein